jgi:hypothetical protein
MRGRAVKGVGSAGVIRRIILAPRRAGAGGKAGKSRIITTGVARSSGTAVAVGTIGYYKSRPARGGLRRQTTMKKILTLALMLLLLQAQTGAVALAAGQSTKDTQTPDEVKVQVNRAGIGEKARVTVRLKDGTKRKGYVSERRDNEFVLRDRKTDAPSTIAYGDVGKIGIDRGHSTARNTAIGVGIGVGAVVLVLAILIASEFD